MSKTEQLEVQYHAVNLDGLARVISRLADDYASTDSDRIWTGRALCFFGALLPIFAWPKSDEIISGRNMFDLDDLIDFANSSNVAMMFSGGSLRKYLLTLPGIYLADGVIAYKNAACAKDHHGYMVMQGRNELLRQPKENKMERSNAVQFLDKIKGAGVVVSNEDILRDALLSDSAAETEFLALFTQWVEQGRRRGVTFHVSAAGVNQAALVDAFVDAYMSNVDAERFIANLRTEPADEIQRQFKARAES